MIRFATFALFAALLCSPAFSQDTGESRVAPAEKTDGGKPALRDKELDRKGAPRGEPGAPARPPRTPLDPKTPPPVVVPLPEMLTNIPADARIAPLGDGFAILESGAAGDRFVALDKDGKSETELFAPGHKVDRWWLSADGKRLLWVSGGKLYSAEPHAKAMDSLGEAPVGAPAVSPDGSRVAFVRGGKLVVRALAGKDEKELTAAAGLFICDAAAWSVDGKKVFALVGPTADEADGIGAADLTGDAPTVARIYQATNAKLANLVLAPTGRWLMFVQAGKAEPHTAALRLLAPDGSEFRTLARAASIDDPMFSPDGQRAYFSARGANGLWQAWEAGLEPDAATGDIPTRRIVEEENRQFLRPVVGRDGLTSFFIREDAEGKGAQVGKVKLR